MSCYHYLLYCCSCCVYLKIDLLKNHFLQIIKAVPSKLCDHSQEMKTLKERRGIVIAVLF